MPILNDVNLPDSKETLPVSAGEPLYVVFTSANDPETGAPWCSDVRASLPVLAETFDNAQGPKAIYESVGPRPGYVCHSHLRGVLSL